MLMIDVQKQNKPNKRMDGTRRMLMFGGCHPPVGSVAFPSLCLVAILHTHVVMLSVVIKQGIPKT